MKSSVYFVGAGPGAVDLITVRGMRLLQKADIIIYAGSLVNKELLEYRKKDCKVYNSANMTLEEVIDVMKDAFADKKMLVRLHTGDQSIYGAVREQMDILDKEGIAYESCPGVSAAFGAASELNLEYTLPDVSQSLIITRMEGRTKVPQTESIESFASHKTTMAIYLSTGMLNELSERLIDGGYAEDTMAVLFYKATWDDQKYFYTNLKNLNQCAIDNNITKTALVIVGDVLNQSKYSKSRLYAPDFSTQFRRGEEIKSRIRVISFTEKGFLLSKKLRPLFDDIELFTKYKTEDSEVKFVSMSTQKWAEECFADGADMIFIGASGIAVRSISRFVSDKLKDPAVVVLDELGQFVIPILSGHVGGANSISNTIAKGLNSIAVITTATDINDAFAVDLFAKENNLNISDRNKIAKVSANALKDRPVRLSIKGYPPKERVDVAVEADIILSPKKYALGIGCKKGKSLEEIEKIVLAELSKKNISIYECGMVASVEDKINEQGIIDFSKKYRIPFATFDTEILNGIDGEFSSSDFVKQTIGVDNVCERSAVAAAGMGSVLVIKKTAENGVTMALARKKDYE